MIRIATAECFTHGNVAREIHAFSRGYPRTYSWRLSPEQYRLSVVAGLFIPTLGGVRSILGFEPLPPADTLDDIKVYDQASDEVMAVKMAEAVRGRTGAVIGIGTTAGIGRGGIAIVSGTRKVLSTSDVYADLRFPDPGEIRRRQESGLFTALRLLERLLENDLPPGKPGEILRVS